MNDEQLAQDWQTLAPAVEQRHRIEARVFGWLEAHDTSLAAIDMAVDADAVGVHGRRVHCARGRLDGVEGRQACVGDAADGPADLVPRK